MVLSAKFSSNVLSQGPYTKKRTVITHKRKHYKLQNVWIVWNVEVILSAVSKSGLINCFGTNLR